MSECLSCNDDTATTTTTTTAHGIPPDDKSNDKSLAPVRFQNNAAGATLGLSYCTVCLSAPAEHKYVRVRNSAMAISVVTRNEGHHRKTRKDLSCLCLSLGKLRHPRILVARYLTQKPVQTASDRPASFLPSFRLGVGLAGSLSFHTNKTIYRFASIRTLPASIQPPSFCVFIFLPFFCWDNQQKKSKR